MYCWTRHIRLGEKRGPGIDDAAMQKLGFFE
jgi:hypothetical protein